MVEHRENGSDIAEPCNGSVTWTFIAPTKNSVKIGGTYKRRSLELFGKSIHSERIALLTPPIETRRPVAPCLCPQ